MSALTIIQHIGRSPSQSNKASKGDKGTQLRKEEIKLFLLVCDMICLCRKSQGIYTHMRVHTHN